MLYEIEATPMVQPRVCVFIISGETGYTLSVTAGLQTLYNTLNTQSRAQKKRNAIAGNIPDGTMFI